METTMDSRAVDRMATSVPRGDAAARCADVLGALPPAALPEVAVLCLPSILVSFAVASVLV